MKQRTVAVLITAGTRGSSALSGTALLQAKRNASSSHPLAGAFYLKTDSLRQSHEEDLERLLQKTAPAGQQTPRSAVSAAVRPGVGTVPVNIVAAPEPTRQSLESTIESTVTAADAPLGLGGHESVPNATPPSLTETLVTASAVGPLEVTTTRHTTVTTTTTTRRSKASAHRHAASSKPTQQSASAFVAEELLNRTFYRRPLPHNLISFESEGGKRMFKAALAKGTAENYFSLVGNFATQHDPSSCGPSALSMVLNSLSIDPEKPWKGVWRWWSDSTLSCLTPLEELNGRGITFGGFERLAVCNGLHVISKRGDHHSYAEFAEDVRQVCQSPGEVQMVVSFARKALQQTGDGHFSPVAALYQPEDGSEPYALVLDVARFKYPSYFVSLRELYDSTRLIDRETGLSRGWYLMRKAAEVEPQPETPAAVIAKPEPIAPKRRRNASVCEIGERMVVSNANTPDRQSAMKSLKEAGLETLISKTIPDTFRSLYPAINNLPPAEQAEAAKAPKPTPESTFELAFSLLFDHTSNLSTVLMDQFLPRSSPDLEAEVREHPIFPLISSLVNARGAEGSWTPERVTLLFLALPPACFKPFILSAFPEIYEMVEAARSAGDSEALQIAVKDWRMEWERRTQQTCECH